MAEQEGVEKKGGWTVETVLDHIRTLIEQQNRLYEARFKDLDRSIVVAFEAQQTGINAAMMAQEKLVSAALAANKEAVTKADFANEKRFEGVNEFRATLADQQRMLMPRAEAEALLLAISRRIEDISARLTLIEGRAGGAKDLWGLLVAGAAILIAAAGFILKH